MTIDIRREFKNAAADAGYTFFYDASIKLWTLYHEKKDTPAEYFTVAVMKDMGVEKFKTYYLG